MENLGNNPENGQENEPEDILDVLESAFEQRVKVELTVMGPNGELRTNSVLVEGFESGVLYVSDSEFAPVMPLEISSVKKAELFEKETRN